MRRERPHKEWKYTVAWAILFLGFVSIALDLTGVTRATVGALEGKVSNSFLVLNLIVAPLSVGVAMTHSRIPALARLLAYVLFLLSFTALPLSLAAFPVATWSMSVLLCLEILWFIPKFNSWRSTKS